MPNDYAKVSVPRTLFDELSDPAIKAKGYRSASDAATSAIRDFITKHKGAAQMGRAPLKRAVRLARRAVARAARGTMRPTRFIDLRNTPPHDIMGALFEHAAKRKAVAQVRAKMYVVFDAKGIRRMNTKFMPALESGEFVMRLDVEVPDTFFERPIPRAKVSVPGDAHLEPQVLVSLGEQITVAQPAPAEVWQVEPFVHEGRTLYAHEVEFKGGRKQTIYFFSAGSPKAGAPCAMPSGYEVATTKNGMPVLRRKAGA